MIIATRCRFGASCVALVMALPGANGCHRTGSSEPSRVGKQARESGGRSGAELMARIEHLEALAPGQGALMTQVGYHFGSLWFALENENWPLADFYLHECRESLEQSVVAKPVRRLSTGEDLNIKGIADALDNTQFADMERAIRAGNRAQAQASYRDAMIVCHSCHQAAEKPFLQVQIPARTPSPSIRFEPVKPK